MVVTYSFGQPLAMVTHLNTLGLTRDLAPEISVYPNPFYERFTIPSAHQDIMDVFVYNLLGNLVMRIKDIGPGAEIDFSEQPPGSYIIQIGSEKGNNSKIVQKL